ncbi:MAG: cation:proton antiporter [Campylobacterota bacterium]|nr:cation:proton antiporter [Campylobacterota bacterium]
MDLLSIIVAALFVSIILNLILKKFGVSSIVGYIFTGIGITFFLDATQINLGKLAHIAEFGIVFLMFTIGLEFSVNHLKRMKKEVFVFGTLQVLLTAFIFTYITHLIFGFDMKTSIVIGSALALSSTAIVLKVLNDNGDIHRPYGLASTGILIFQDLAVIPILLMITILADSSVSLQEMLLNTFYSAVFVGIVLFILGKYATEKFLAYVVDARSEEIFIASILLIVLSSALFAHTFGFSYSLGAFLAGMLIAETKYKFQIEADLVPFRDILLGVFFITVGMQVHLDSFIENFFTIVALSVVILLVKAIIIFTILRVFTFTKRAFKIALTLAQVGEFSFAVFALASANNLISDELNQIMIPVVILSLLFTSLALKHVRAFVNFFQKESSEAMSEPLMSADIKNHIIVCGYSLLGQKIVKQLKNSKLPYVAIEHDRQHVKKGQENGDIVFFGNAASKHMLNSMYINNANSVIIAIDNDEKVRLIAQAIRNLNPNISIIVKITNQAQIEDFKDMDINGFVNENELVAKAVVEKATRCEI